MSRPSGFGRNAGTSRKEAFGTDRAVKRRDRHPSVKTCFDGLTFEACAVERGWSVRCMVVCAGVERKLNVITITYSFVWVGELGTRTWRSDGPHCWPHALLCVQPFSSSLGPRAISRGCVPPYFDGAAPLFFRR